jgi:hypothetical protein
MRPLSALAAGATLSAAKPSPDIADIDQMIASIDTSHQRSELAAIAVPTADDNLMSCATLGFAPGISAPGNIRRARLF